MRITGEIRGKLWEDQGCIRINDYLVIWPPHYGADSENGQISILDGRDTLASVGEEVHMGGGEKPSLVGVIGVSEQLIQEIPPECPGPYWISGGIIPTPKD